MKTEEYCTLILKTDEGTVYGLSDAYGDTCSLIVGRDKALLFDTMMATTDLKKQVEQITEKPLTVVCSHGHFDHTGGCGAFGRAYLGREDFPVVPANLEIREIIEQHSGADLSGTVPAFDGTTQYDPLDEGMIFDLGGIELKTVSLKGHTAGSMGLLWEKERLLFTGDAMSPQMCLFFPESLDPSVYVETLDRAEKLPFDNMLCGHFLKLFPKSLIETYRRALEVPKKKKGYPYFYSLIPQYTGRVYMLESYNEVVGGPVCIILKDAGTAEK